MGYSYGRIRPMETGCSHQTAGWLNYLPQIPKRGLLTLVSLLILGSVWLLASSRYLTLDNRSFCVGAFDDYDRYNPSHFYNNGGGNDDDESYPLKAAVIIETRMTPSLIPSILQFSSVLDSSWPIILFTLESSWHEPFPPPLQRLLRSGRLTVRFLPGSTQFRSHQSVSNFLVQPWIWEQLQPFARVLIFQTDSVLCSNSQVTVDDFMEWDLIGAPIPEHLGVGYNGGLSLRNPRLMLEIAREDGGEKFEQRVANGSVESKFEDQWFFLQAQKRGARLPPQEVAQTFSVEVIFFETPLGYHQPLRWQADKMPQILARCPEAGMVHDPSFRFESSD